MPISGPSSYVPTTEEFLPHWAAADAALGAGNEIVLPGGVNRAALQTKLNTLVAKQVNIQAKLNVEEVGRSDVELKRQSLLLRANQFNDKIRAMFPDSKWIRALPNVPTINDAQSKFVQPLDDIGNLWGMVNADPDTPAPISLLGGYLVAAFLADVTALKNAATELNIARSNMKLALEDRNDVQNDIYQILKSYRQVLPTFFAEGQALVQTLPTLTPAPGSTPDAVSATGAWDIPSQMAKLHWTESTDPHLSGYELRYCVGPTYSTVDELTVPGGQIPVGGTRQFSTLAGLPMEGSTATFRVYVITATNNEKGSNNVTIYRMTGDLPPSPPTP